jgi:hypothetical protein
MQKRPRFGPPPRKTTTPASRAAAAAAAAEAKAKAESTVEASDPSLGRPALKVPQMLAELEEFCKQVGIRLTYEAIGGELGSGGLCKVKGKWRAIFDKRTTPAERVNLLAPLLARFFRVDMQLSEPVRELLSRMQKPIETPAEAKAATP